MHDICIFTGERERVQKKTFTKWVNSHLIRVESRVNELYQDLKDGRKLIMLLEILSGEKIVSGVPHFWAQDFLCPGASCSKAS